MIPSTEYEGRIEGERLKAEALDLLSARREVYVNRGRRALLRRLLTAGTATADDVRNAVELPEGIDPVCLGAVPGTLARAGIIAPAGFVASRRTDAPARPVSVWRSVNRSAGLDWLAAHPDRPDPLPMDDGEPAGFLFDMEDEPSPTVAPAGLV